MKKVLLILSLFFIISCENKVEDVVENTGFDVIFLGNLPNFGNVDISGPTGSKRSNILIKNYGPEDVNLEFTINPPFFIDSYSPNCANKILKAPSGDKKMEYCEITIKFMPTARGNYSEEFEINGTPLKITGNGFDYAGMVEYQNLSWSFGSIIAGSSNLETVTMKNIGDSTIETPSLELGNVTGVSISSNSCGKFMTKGKVCEIQFRVIKEKAGSVNETFSLFSKSAGRAYINFKANVTPSSPSGAIVFNSVPTSMPADESSEFLVDVAPIRDFYENIVKDGTKVKVVLNNLTLPDGIDTFTTSGGVFQFKIKSTRNKSDPTISGTLASISVMTFEESSIASGFYNFRLTSGPAIGTIKSREYSHSLIADGQSENDIGIYDLRDTFGNIVEDGSPVYSYLKPLKTSTGDTLTCSNYNEANNFNLGQIMNPTTATVAGEASIRIRSSSIIGKVNLVITSGSACGVFPIEFTAGTATGIIPMSSNKLGINADVNYKGNIEQNRATITLGPVKDVFGNLVSSKDVYLSITNGIIVDNDISIVRTNEDGIASFKIQGVNANSRGNIRVVSNIGNAQGEINVFAFAKKTYTPLGSTNPNNNFRLYMNFESTDQIPSARTAWGKITFWTNLENKDNSFFGDVKKMGAPVLTHTNLPRFESSCLFPVSNDVFFMGCYVDEYKESKVYPSSIAIRKLPDGNSTMISSLNQDKEGITHQKEVTGCWVYSKEPIVGSPSSLVPVLFSTVNERACLKVFTEGLPLPKFCSVDVFNQENQIIGTQILPEAECGDNVTRSKYCLPDHPSYDTDYCDLETRSYYNESGTNSFSTKKIDIKYPSISMLGGSYNRLLTLGGYYSYPINLSDYDSFGALQNVYRTFSSSMVTWTPKIGDALGVPIQIHEDEDSSYLTTVRNGIYNKVIPILDKLLIISGIDIKGDSHSLIGNTIVQNTNFSMTSIINNDFGVYDELSTPKYQYKSIQSADKIQEDDPTSPSPRILGGSVYIPEDDSLLFGGGIGPKNSTQIFPWNENTDMWKVDNYSTSPKWRRICQVCGFQTNAYGYVGNFYPNLLETTGLKEQVFKYNPFSRKVLVYNKDSSSNVKEFNPFLGVNLVDNLEINGIAGDPVAQNVSDIVINPTTGRTYIYKKGGIDQTNSKLYEFDLGNSQIPYIKAVLDLGTTAAKTFIEEARIGVYAFSSIKDSSGVIVSGGAGVIVKVFNFETDEWVNVGDNSAKEQIELTAQNLIEFSFSTTPTSGNPNVKDLVSNTGEIHILIYPKNLSSYSGDGTVELKIDQIEVQGVF